MKRTILLACAFLLGSQAFAGFSKGSAELNAVGSAWKSPSTSAAQRQNLKSHHDLTIVYGGQDIDSGIRVIG